MLDRLLSMQVFLAVARHGTFTAAAEELGLSRAMASKHLQTLETHLGVRLVNRTTRTTRLTEAGARYYEQLSVLLTELDDVEAGIGQDATQVRGTLTVAAPPGYGATHVAPIVGAFMRHHPGIRVRLVLIEGQPDLVDAGIDVAITVRELADTSYIARKLGAVRLIVCAAQHYLDSRGRPRKPADLVDHNCLIYAETAAQLRAEWLFRRRGHTLPQAVTGNFVSNVGQAIRELAIAGGGVARLPDYLVEDALKTGELVEVLQTFAPPLRPVHALYAHRDHLPAKVLRFLEYAADSYRGN